MNPSGKSAGGGKGGGKRACGGGDDLIKSTYKLTTSREHMLSLRKALQTDDGFDKDVTESFSAFTSFKRNGLDAVVSFVPGKRLSKPQLRFIKSSMQDHSDALEECALTVEDKVADLKHPAARFLFVMEAEKVEEDAAPPAVLAFVHFRFTLQGELQGVMQGEPVLFVADAFVAPAAQRKGLGKHLFSLLELVARKEAMTGLMVAGYSNLAEIVTPFVLTKLKGYEAETVWAPDEEGYVVFSKSFSAAKPAASSPDSVLNSAPAAERDTSGAAALATQFAAVPVAVAPTAVPFWEQTNAPAAIAVTTEGVAGDSEDEEENEEDDEEEDSEQMAERVLDELSELFISKNGREPTEDEMAQWRETLAAASSDVLP